MPESIVPVPNPSTPTNGEKFAQGGKTDKKSKLDYTNLVQYKGILPYSSELFGVYQPLLGWKARLSQERIAGEINTNIVNAIAGQNTTLQEKPPVINNPGEPIEWTETPPPGWDVMLPSFISKKAASVIIKELKSRNIENKDLVGALKDLGLMKKLVGDIIKNSLPKPIATAQTILPALTEGGINIYKDLSTKAIKLLGARKVVGTQFFMANKVVGQTNNLDYNDLTSISVFKYLLENKPDSLNIMLSAQAKKVMDKLKPITFVDPLETFDPQTQNMILSPVGLVDIYRQYFFELDSFLGPSVGHIWVSPGGTVELYEVNTRKSVEERFSEISTEITNQKETLVTDQDEISTAINIQNSRNTSFGVSASGGFDYSVAHASASASMSMDTIHSNSEETIHKHSRQQSEKITSEIKQNYKTTFRTSVEFTDTTSRRYVLTNTTPKLLNFELRRKMRLIAIQTQHIGTQLCWQVYLDEPGIELNIPELIHVAKPADINPQNRPPDAIVPLEPKETQIAVDFPFMGVNDNSDRDETYVDGKEDNNNNGGKISTTRTYKAIPPSSGYKLSAINLVSIDRVEPGEDLPVVDSRFTITQTEQGNFEIYLKSVNFNDQPSIKFNLQLIWEPPDQSKVIEDYAAKLAAFNEETKREQQNAYLTAVRERIKIASRIQNRSSDDLREEERIIIYRQLIRKLTKAGVNQTAHVTSELIRAIFDVDTMLYFVAPDWWRPRINRIMSNKNASEDVLTQENTMGWGGYEEAKHSKYYITEESSPAKLGSSIGWLLQLDGDNHRNAFLNSPWVKAIIPVRPGREMAALNWLKQAQVEGVDGLDANYGGSEKELQGMKIEDAIIELAKKVKIINSDPSSTSAAEKVYQTGFDPLEGGFDITKKPLEVFDQWIEILPTDQIVAKEYEV